MTLPIRSRTLASAAVAALLAVSFGTAASPAELQGQAHAQARANHAPDRGDRNERRQERRDNRSDRRNDRRDDRADRRNERRDDRHERRSERRNDRNDRRDDRRHDRDRARQQQQRRLAQQRHYQQQRLAQQRHYQQQRRAQQRYYNQQRHRQAVSYRYGYGGNWYRTDHMGADLLRHAVRQGYEQGLRAGRADRHDRWARGYRNSRVWIDASHGYNSYHVRRADYQYYFRQGFERGYDDGFRGQYRYGRYDDRNDTAIILTTVLAAILGLQAMG